MLPFEALSPSREVSSAKFDERSSKSTSALASTPVRQTSSSAAWSPCRTVPARKFALPFSQKALLPRPPKKLAQKSSVPTTWLREIQAGNIDFDATVATPRHDGARSADLVRFSALAVLCRTPSSAPLLPDVTKAINELKGGKVEYRADRYGIAHVIIGKVSFEAEKLAENYGAVYDEIVRMKPSAAKGKYLKSITVSSTMGPGIAVDSSVSRNFASAE